jgi:hypothetical protein
VSNKLFYFDDEETEAAKVLAFMKLAGPYWMSCVTKNEWSFAVVVLTRQTIPSKQ